MHRLRLFLGAVALAGLVALFWLYRDNQRLRGELADLGRMGAAAGTKLEQSAPQSSASVSPARSSAPAQLRSLSSLAQRLSRARPELEAPAGEGRTDRRLRREKLIRDLFGRDPGETDEEYRARVLPVLDAYLEGPREELAAARRELEAEAGVTEEQHDQLEEVFADVYTEAIELTNQAIAGGDITPYDLDWSGILSYGGGLGAILDSAEARIESVLTPDQVELIRTRGFDWGEFLAVNAPWEAITPPPSGGDS